MAWKCLAAATHYQHTSSHTTAHQLCAACLSSAQYHLMPTPQQCTVSSHADTSAVHSIISCRHLSSAQYHLMPTPHLQLPGHWLSPLHSSPPPAALCPPPCCCSRSPEDEVHAGVSEHWLAQLAHLQRKAGLLEGRLHLARPAGVAGEQQSGTGTSKTCSCGPPAGAPLHSSAAAGWHATAMLHACPAQRAPLCRASAHHQHTALTHHHHHHHHHHQQAHPPQPPPSPEVAEVASPAGAAAVALLAGQGGKVDVTRHKLLTEGLQRGGQAGVVRQDSALLP
jgi:hypothetical protein